MDAAAARVRELLATYEPPSFDHVPDPDAALFLCAIDHKSGYRGRYMVDGQGPFEGSALLWAVGLRESGREGGLLQADRLRAASGKMVGTTFRIGGETVAGPERRAELWRDLAAGLQSEYDGSAQALLAASDGRLGGASGVVARLARFVAFSDPLAKKAFLYAKICERRGWFEVSDPECWEVCADNVLMRLALRSGLVADGPLDQVRAETRAALKTLAAEAGTTPPVLDDLLWELGRDDPDLLGRAAGDIHEPPREAGSDWY
jgi:hypothetical protein